MPEGLSHPNTQREFYGPLNPLEVEDAFPYNYEAYEHPEDINRFVRVIELPSESEHVPSINEQIGLMYAMLNGLDQFNINHTHPKYFLEEYNKGTMIQKEIGIEADFVKDAEPYGFIIDGEVSDDQFTEVDQVIANIAKYLVAIEMQGGVISEEVLDLHQFVYSATLDPGKRFLLVDVDPAGLSIVDPAEGSKMLAWTIRKLVVSAAMAAEKRPDLRLDSLQTVSQLIQNMNVSDNELSQMQVELREILRGDLSSLRYSDLAEDS